MKPTDTDYSWQAWAFVAVFAVGAVFKTVADRRVARATESLAFGQALESAQVTLLTQGVLLYLDGRMEVGRDAH